MTIALHARRRRAAHHLRSWESLEFTPLASQSRCTYRLWYKLQEKKHPVSHSQAPWQGMFPPYAPVLEAY
jgi:hypothetical protein